MSWVMETGCLTIGAVFAFWRKKSFLYTENTEGSETLQELRNGCEDVDIELFNLKKN